MDAKGIVKSLKACAAEHEAVHSLHYAKMLADAADLIESLADQLEATIAGQETLQRALAESQRRVDKAEEAMDDIKENGLCASCHGCYAPHEPDRIIWCYGWQWRGVVEGEKA